MTDATTGGMIGASEFDTATAVTTEDGSTFRGEIVDGWDIGGNANGGYLLAIAARAMRDAWGRTDPLSLTAHFLAPGRPGPVSIETSVVKAGRRLMTMTGSMRAGEREVLRLLGTFGDLGTGTDGFRHVDLAPPDLPPIDECVFLANDPASAVQVPLTDRLSMHIRPQDAGFGRGTKSGRAVIEGWFGFADGRAIDTISLMLAADAFPPPVFNIDIPAGWVPTVELTVHVRGVPAPGLLRARFHTEIVQHGFLQADSELWDTEGTLVAQSRQLAMLPLG